MRQQAADAGNSTARAQLEADRKMPGTQDFRRADALTDFKRYADAFPYAKRSAEAGGTAGGARGSAIAKQAAANLRSPDYDQRPPSSAGGNGGTTFCTSGHVWDSSFGYCRLPGTSDPPLMPTQSP